MNCFKCSFKTCIMDFYHLSFSTGHGNIIEVIAKISTSLVNILNQHIDKFKETECCGTNRCIMCEIGPLALKSVDKIDNYQYVEINEHIFDSYVKFLVDVDSRTFEERLKIINKIIGQSFPIDKFMKYNDDNYIIGLSNALDIYGWPNLNEYISENVESGTIISKNIKIEIVGNVPKLILLKKKDIYNEFINSKFMKNYWIWYLNKIITNIKIMDDLFDECDNQTEITDLIIEHYIIPTIRIKL